MARVSFTLRRPDTAADLGSYLRYDDALTYETSGGGGVLVPPDPRTDVDSALRSDGLQIAPAQFTSSFFSATSVCYGEVDLEWSVPVVEEIPATPDIVGIVLVTSPDGEPQTISDGSILVESAFDTSYRHTGLTEGRWAYYSLFVNYRSTGGDNYYERAASLAVLVPKNYGSTLLLWNRIPEYYRYEDARMGTTEYSSCIGVAPGDGVVGPLFKFLSIFGFEMDRMRTLIDYQMVSNDPALSYTENLDALAYQLAVPMRSSDLGAARLRGLLNDIGWFRRSKGTLAGTEYFARAVTGSDVDIDTETGEITIYSQRVNYITVPKTGNGITQHRPAHEDEVITPLPFSEDMSAYDPYDVSGTTFTSNGTGASVGVTHALIHLDSPVPVTAGDRVVFSVQSNVGTDGIVWVRLVDGSENEMGFQDTPTLTTGARSFEIEVASGASVGTFTNSYIEYLVDLDAVPVFDNSLLLAERNHVGEYFDGDTVRGGWLIDSSSVSDYRWAGSANASVSLFAQDYERTKGVIADLLFDELPITEVSKYTIVSYNAVPGF